MADTTNFRRERIEKLLYELRYEVERGMVEAEIDEALTFEFIVPISRSIPDGVVYCQFRTMPMTRYAVSGADLQPRLKLVK